jgi:GST-like protein
MIELYFAATPNGLKIKLFLEETGLPYKVLPVSLSKGEQFKPTFLAISPNNKIPAIVDPEPKGGGAPIPIFESGAILVYLAEKTGRFLPAELRGRIEVLKWLFWQVGGLGPMAGQAGHFRAYAPEPVPYAVDRYTKEVNRLYGVLDKQLSAHEYVAGAYSIADMAIYPWIVPHKPHGQKLEDFPHLKRWFETVKARPAVVKTYEGVEEAYSSARNISDEERRVLFGQTADSIKR